MKFKRLLYCLIGAVFGIAVMSGCAAKALEREINVVFVNEGQIVDNGSVTQFKNIQSPVIDDAYIPTDYRFLGWTAYEDNQLDLHDVTHFRSQYIGGGRMVHFMEVEKFAVNQTVTLRALIMHKDDIPHEYHYAVVAWYDKPATSGISADRIAAYELKVKAYLASEGVSESDINTLLFRGYSGNVGPSTGQIMYDGDVDIMLGWGSASNVTTTGSIPPEALLQSVSYQITYEGAIKNRYVHRLGDSVGANKVMEYLLSQESIDFFNE